MGTREDIRWGVHHGFYDVMRDAIAGHGDGVNSNIIDDVILRKDGDVAINKSFGTGATYDGFATANEIRWGQCLAVADGLQKFLIDLDEFYTTYSADANRDTIVQYYMELLHGITEQNADLLSVINVYFNYRDTPNGAYDIDDNVLAGHLYCGGITKQSVNRWSITDTNGTLDDMFLNTIKAISQDTFDQWIASSDGLPRTGYEQSECYRVPSQSFNYNPSNKVNGDYHILTALPANRKWRLEIDVITPFIDANGNTWDGVYYVPNGGVPTIGAEYRTKLAKSGSSATSSSLPVYLNGTGKYVLEFSVAWSPTAIKTWFAFAGVDGSLDYTIYDLGAI